MAKNQLFEQDLQDTAAVFKALSHPARLAILKYVSDSEVCISGDISDKLPLSRTTVHQHLKELKKLHLIQGEINGVRTCYCLNTKHIDAIKSRLNNFLSTIKCCS